MASFPVVVVATAARVSHRSLPLTRDPPKRGSSQRYSRPTVFKKHIPKDKYLTKEPYLPKKFVTSPQLSPCPQVTPLVHIPLPLPDVPVGGRLSQFVDHWERVCDDSHVLEVVRSGVSLSFQDRPTLLPHPVFSKRPERQQVELQKHVDSMLLKGAVELAPLPSLGYYSNMFLVPKKNGEMRPIINLKSLNTSVEKEKFKMETQRAIRKALTKGEWVTSIDLKDAYFHVPIKDQAKKFLRFTVRETVYQFQALPFGLTTAPKEFTRVTAILASIVHRKGINLHLYLDDWLLRAKSYQKCLTQTKEVLTDMTQLGFIVNPDKSELVPTQQKGEDFDLALGIVRPTQEKVDKILTLCRILRKHPCQEARFLLKVLGVLNAVADVIPLGRLHMRPLQLYLLSQWSMSIQPLSYKVFLNSFFQDHLLWWNNPQNLLQGQLLQLPKETEELCTDSSLKGWGATLNAVHMAQGSWDQETSEKYSINWLELKTVHLGLVHFLDLLKNKSVMIRSDNLATVYNLTKQGGTHSPDLCYLAWEILCFCRDHHIADQLSRAYKAIPTEWTLNKSVFRAVVNELGEPGLDLFATGLNNQLPVYVSPCPDPQALALDALSLDWNTLPLAYAFPPMPILPKVLQKIRDSTVTVIRHGRHSLGFQTC